MLFRLMIAGMMVLFVGARLALAEPAPRSLIHNGNFETDDNDDKTPDGWGAPAGVSYPIEDGNHFVRLTVQEPGKMVMIYQSIPMTEAMKSLELSYRVRYEDIKVGKEMWFDGRIIMNFKDAEKKPLKPSPSPPIFRKSSKGWVEKSQKFLVPEGAKTLEIMPCLFNAAAGTLDFDDFKLVELDAAATAELKTAYEAAAVERAARDAAQEKKADEQIAARLEADGNLLANGNFEKPSKQGGFPDGWGRLSEGSGITWQSDGDDHFMRLTQVEPGKVTMLYRIVPLPTDAKGIEVTIRYRTDGVQKGKQMPGDARAILHWLSGARVGHLEAGHAVKPEPPTIGFSSKAKEWTESSKRMLVPEGATKLQIMPGLWFAKAGTVDLAEIAVKPMSSVDADVMAAEQLAAFKLKNERAAIIEKELAMPAITPELKVSGNQLVGPDGKGVWLQGLCVDSMEWSHGENVLWSIHVAIDDWKSNCIRLPVIDPLWFGQEHKGTPASDREKYRGLVDQAVKLCAAKGAYLVLDLHRFGAPMPAHVDFWKDAAERYKNNPAVLFELFNEPHGIPWNIWRDGGDTSATKHADNAVVENTEKNSDKISVGMQALVDAVRSTGARNIIVAGGLAWSYDLSGILNGYALAERDGGNGIMYSHHNYPWKSGWQKAVLDAAEKYPIFVGEVGCPEKWEDFSFIKVDERTEKLGPGCTWPADMLGTIQKHKLNWTGFSFHPRCGPMVIKDWNYTPTEYWGVFVKQALEGKQFEVERLR